MYKARRIFSQDYTAEFDIIPYYKDFNDINISLMEFMTCAQRYEFKSVGQKGYSRFKSASTKSHEGVFVYATLDPNSKKLMLSFQKQETPIPETDFVLPKTDYQVDFYLNWLGNIKKLEIQELKKSKWYFKEKNLIEILEIVSLFEGGTKKKPENTNEIFIHENMAYCITYRETPFDTDDMSNEKCYESIENLVKNIQSMNHGMDPFTDKMGDLIKKLIESRNSLRKMVKNEYLDKMEFELKKIEISETRLNHSNDPRTMVHPIFEISCFIFDSQPIEREDSILLSNANVELCFDSVHKKNMKSKITWQKTQKKNWFIEIKLPDKAMMAIESYDATNDLNK